MGVSMELQVQYEILEKPSVRIEAIQDAIKASLTS
jgi:hypothetical protein